MSPRTENQFEEIRETKKALILDSALHLFAEQGFHATSISKIAKQAKISKGLMYNYFESKEELLKIIIKKGVDDLTMYFDRNHDGVITNDELEYWIDQTFAIMLKNTPFWKLYFSMVMQPQVMKHFEQDFSKLFGPIMEVLLLYFEKKGYEDPMVEMRLFFALLDGVGMHYIVDPENFPVEGVIKRIKEVYIKNNKS